MMMTRTDIIRRLVETLQPLEYTIALWEGGAPGFNRTDEWSDIDLYVVVDDARVAHTFKAVEHALKSLSPIQQKYEVKHPGWPGVSQAFYRLENASEYLIIDLAILTLSSPEKFLEPMTHGKAIFYFNKNNQVTIPVLDIDTLPRKLSERLERLKGRFDMFHNFVQKEINRGNHLEAIDLYHTLLNTLVEALRITHNPIHHEFRMRYVHYELPDDVIEKLTHLYFIADPQDLQSRYQVTAQWFYEIISRIREKDLARLLKQPPHPSSATAQKRS